MITWWSDWCMLHQDSVYQHINSLNLWRCVNNFKGITFKLIVQNSSLGTRCENAPQQMWHNRKPMLTQIDVAIQHTVYPKKYAHGFCFAVLCCGYTLTDFPISIRLTSLALWQSNDCPSASKATLMNMDKYLMWIHYERLHNHNKAKHNKTVCIFLGIYCIIIQVGHFFSIKDCIWV